MSDLYSAFDYSAEEIALLKKHDEGEELHPFVPVGNTGDETENWFSCVACGDDSSGLMHNNTWRNVEPLMEDEDLNRCSNGCVCTTDDEGNLVAWWK